MAAGALPGRNPGIRTRPASRRNDAWTAASTSSAVASTWRATCEAALRSRVTVIDGLLDGLLPGVSVMWVLMLLGSAVRGPRLELGRVAPRDPKSRASTDSAIRARSVNRPTLSLGLAVDVVRSRSAWRERAPPQPAAVAGWKPASIASNAFWSGPVNALLPGASASIAVSWVPIPRAGGRCVLQTVLASPTGV